MRTYGTRQHYHPNELPKVEQEMYIIKVRSFPLLTSPVINIEEKLLTEVQTAIMRRDHYLKTLIIVRLRPRRFS